MAQTPYEIAMDYALNLLASRSRSIEELREKITRRRAVNDETVTRVIDRLKELGYLDDQRFASAYALSRIASRPLGRARVKRDLRNRHVPADIANEALDKAFQETTEDSLIQQAIEKRIRLRGLPTTRAESQKLFAHLIRLGFGFDLAIEKVRSLQKDAGGE